MTSDQPSGAAMPDDGILHHRDMTFGDIPIELLNNPKISDGAIRIYAHLSWRYGNNMPDESIAERFGISESQVAARIKELELNNWVVVEDRNGKHFYHLFENQEDCLNFKRSGGGQ